MFAFARHDDHVVVVRAATAISRWNTHCFNIFETKTKTKRTSNRNEQQQGSDNTLK